MSKASLLSLEDCFSQQKRPAPTAWIKLETPNGLSIHLRAEDVTSIEQHLDGGSYVRYQSGEMIDSVWVKEDPDVIAAACDECEIRSVLAATLQYPVLTANAGRVSEA